MYDPHKEGRGIEKSALRKVIKDNLAQVKVGEKMQVYPASISP